MNVWELARLCSKITNKTIEENAKDELSITHFYDLGEHFTLEIVLK